jgi:hypothetical protein
MVSKKKFNKLDGNISITQEMRTHFKGVTLRQGKILFLEIDNKHGDVTLIVMKHACFQLYFNYMSTDVYKQVHEYMVEVCRKHSIKGVSMGIDIVGLA